MRARLLLLGLVFYFGSVVNGDNCVYTTGNDTIDLRSFGSKSGAKYTEIYDTSGSKDIKYSFNGCFSFSIGNECKDAAVCSTNTQTNEVKLLGKQPAKNFDYNSGFSQFEYDTDSSTNVRVFLFCDTTNSITMIKQTDTSFLLTIKDPCGCANACSGEGSSGAGLSGGAVFIIILVSAIFIYFVFGALFLKFVRKAEGSNVIPNRGFWLSVFSYAISGLRFLSTKVCCRNSNYASV